VYQKLEKGDRIMDFSSAGYMGGGVALPEVLVRAVVDPLDGDATAAIQRAIDAVSKLDLVDGHRGAVLLKPGVYACENALVIPVSGVVLRGSGSGTNATILKMTGRPHVCISLAGSSRVEQIGRAARIVDPYVPSGARSFTVDSASGFSPGDSVLVRRPVTAS